MADKTNIRAKLFGIIPMWWMKNPQRVYLFGAIPLWKRSVAAPHAEIPVQTVPLAVPAGDGVVDVINVPVSAVSKPNRTSGAPKKTPAAPAATEGAQAPVNPNAAPAATEGRVDKGIFKEAMKTAKAEAKKAAAAKAKETPDPEAQKFWKTYKHGAKRRELKRLNVIQAAMGPYSVEEVGPIYDLCSKNRHLKFNNVMANIEAIMINTGIYEPSAAVTAFADGMKREGIRDFGKYIGILDSRLSADVKNIEVLCAQSTGRMYAKKVNAFEILKNLEQIKADTGKSDPVEAAKEYIRRAGVERAAKAAAGTSRAALGTGPNGTEVSARPVMQKPMQLVPPVEQPGAEKPEAPAVVEAPAAKPKGRNISARIAAAFAAIAASVAAWKIFGSRRAAQVVAAPASVAQVVAAPPAPVEVAPPAQVEVAPASVAQVVAAPPAPVEVAPPAQVEVAPPAQSTVAPPAPVEVAPASVAQVEVAPPAPVTSETDSHSVAPARTHMLSARWSNAIAAGLIVLTLAGSLLLPGRIGKSGNYQPPQPTPIVVVQPSENIEVNVLPWVKGGDTAFSTVEGIAVEQVRVQLGMEKLNPQDVQKGMESRAIQQVVRDIVKRNNLKNPDLIQKGSTLKVNRNVVVTNAQRFGAVVR